FAHPITEEQKAQIQQLTGQPIQRIIELPVQFDHARGFHEQVLELLERVELSASEWQTTPLIVNLPSLSVIAATLLAELHGRMGYFPPVVRLRPVEGAVPPRFEVAEVLNLQQIRDGARVRRASG
ncbi:MAG: CRISPR-associated protein Csx15, partial [Fimbriimonadales bacterium]|nr:CRISPR-associated protein Csx15 [Fimbriimonadales bacterium]